MEKLTYEKAITALLVTDPYNDLISDGGKLWNRVKAVAEANNCISNMLHVLTTARKAGLRAFLCDASSLPARRLRDLEVHCADSETRKAEPSFRLRHVGGEIRSEFQPEPGEIVATEHWCSSGFANTDLDLQLKKHGIHKLIVIGLIAHTCIEATVRYAAELGYEVTVVSDAVADYSDREMHAALEVNLPNYASATRATANRPSSSCSW